MEEGKEYGYLTRKMQEAIDIVVEWGYNWGFRFFYREDSVSLLYQKKSSGRTKVKKVWERFRESWNFYISWNYFGFTIDICRSYQENGGKVQESNKYIEMFEGERMGCK